VTARSRRNGPIRKRRSPVRCGEGSARFKNQGLQLAPGLRLPNKSANGSRANRRRAGRTHRRLPGSNLREEKKKPAAARNLESPFPVSPSGGKPGREGSPHAGSTLRASQKRWHASSYRLPPQEGLRPLVHPPLVFTGKGVDKSRPSHGSRDRQGAGNSASDVIKTRRPIEWGQGHYVRLDGEKQNGFVFSNTVSRQVGNLPHFTAL
jgi:hypothetical protein